jgi:hypothetical protein
MMSNEHGPWHASKTCQLYESQFRHDVASAAALKPSVFIPGLAWVRCIVHCRVAALTWLEYLIVC